MIVPRTCSERRVFLLAGLPETPSDSRYPTESTEVGRANWFAYDAVRMDAVVQRICVYPLAIPLRHRIIHAASQRETADPIVMGVELRDGTVGYGETLPRDYVTGESVQSVLEAIENTLAPALVSFHPPSFPEALAAIEALPWHDTSAQPIPAARAAVELALLDAVLRTFHKDFDAVVGWMGLPGFGRPGSLATIRYSGVLASDDPSTVMRQLRWMYWGGLRHFKLKVGMPGDVELTRRVASYLRLPMARGKATFRVDANGAWTSEQAAAWLAATADLPIAAVEQPVAKGREAEFTALVGTMKNPPVSPLSKGGGLGLSPLGTGGGAFLSPLGKGGGGSPSTWMHDESLVTMDDARRLIELDVAGGFNIRLSKCGGMMPSLRLAALARREGAKVQLGCMVGETSILSAAGIRFLEVCPGVTWAEGCFGSFLLGENVVPRALRFGYGGRVPKLPGVGWGILPEFAGLERLCSSEPIVLNL